MHLKPFESIAGLKEEDAVWPLTVGSVSVISSVMRGGSEMAIGVPSWRESVTSMFSCRNDA